MESVKVSIITVSYNAVDTIERTILSVINQTYSNIEYIIIDGNSTDGTVNIIKKYDGQIAKWLSEPDNGLYDAMNKGIQMATGDVIGIINSDDCYHDIETIANIVDIYKKKKEWFVLHGKIRYFHEDGTITVDVPKQNPEYIKRGPFIFHPTMFVPKKFYDRVGCFNVKYSIAADYDLMLRLYLGGCPFIYMDKIVTDMYAGGASDKKMLRGFTECYKIMLRNKINPLFATYFYLKRVIGAKLFPTTTHGPEIPEANN